MEIMNIKNIMSMINIMNNTNIVNNMNIINIMKTMNMMNILNMLKIPWKINFLIFLNPHQKASNKIQISNCIALYQKTASKTDFGLCEVPQPENAWK